MKKLLQYLFENKVTIIFKSGVVMRIRNLDVGLKHDMNENSDISFYYIAEWYEPWPKIL